MNSRTPSRRTVGLATTMLGVVTLGLSLAAPTANAAVGPDVAPVLVDITSNITCAELGGSAPNPPDFAGGQTWLETKFDPPVDGTQNGITVDFTGNTFTWTSTIGIDAVYVKSGSGGSNMYVYAGTADAPESFGDDGLTSNQAISHVSFCYDTANPSTTTTTSSTSTSTTSSSTTSTTAGPTTTTSTTLAPTTTTTEAPTTTTTQPVTTTTAEVLGGVITTTSTTAADPGTTTTTNPTEVAGVQVVRQLPRTGSDVRPFAYLGCTMIGVGLVLTGQYRRQTNYEF